MFSFIMAFLLSSAPSVLAFAKRSPPNCFNKRWMKVIQSAGWCSCNLVRRSSSFTDRAENDPPEIHGVRNRSAHLLPYFPIYYNDCYEVELPRGHRFPMEKYRKVRMALQNKILSSGDAKKQVDCEFRKSPLVTVQQLSTTHDITYISRYLTGELTERENRNIGFPWSEQHVNRSLSSVGGTVNAALSVWEEYVRRRTIDMQQRQIINDTLIDGKESIEHLCWGAHVAGGTHHAFSDYGEGFCIFSDIAVAANVLLRTYGEESQQSILNPISTIRRILIIDLDVHQGNGNAALFRKNDRVKTFSMHCVGNYFSEKQYSDLDVELPVGCDNETYLSTLRYWLNRIRNYNFDKEKDSSQKKFDVIFYQAGVDIHHADRLGKLSITQDGISSRNSLVFDFAKKLGSPLIITMGGGYPKGDDWAPILKAHTNVYIEAHEFLARASNI